MRRARQTCPCSFCANVPGDPGEQRRFCTVFKALKKNTSAKSYLEDSLKPCDSSGFAAAGVLLFRRTEGFVEVLMARELRDRDAQRDERGGDKLNFLGGKRLGVSESAISVAVRKIDLETGGKLSRSTIAKMKPGFSFVHWNFESKFVLYLFELTVNPTPMAAVISSCSRRETLCWSNGLPLWKLI